MGGKKKKLTKEDVAWLIEFHATDPDGFEEYCDRNSIVFALACSYGKDSLASLHVIKDILHYPLHSVFTTDVWATQTISANLPPVEEFKKKADKWILDHYGIEVTHLCAKDKNGNKLSYNDIFYRELTPRSKIVEAEREREERSTDSRHESANGVGQDSSLTPWNGFPYASFMGGWCHELKETKRIPDILSRRGNWCTRLKVQGIPVPSGSRRTMVQRPQDTTAFRQIIRTPANGAGNSRGETEGF